MGDGGESSHDLQLALMACVELLTMPNGLSQVAWSSLYGLGVCFCNSRTDGALLMTTDYVSPGRA